MGISYVLINSRPKHRALVAIIGAMAVFGIAFAIEWNQRFLAGRSADITDAIIALLAWLAPWLYPPVRAELQVSIRHTPSAKRDKGGQRQYAAPAIILTGSIIAAAVIGFHHLDGTVSESLLDESTWYRLPPPSELPPVQLDGFHFEHPRLPAPEKTDISRLKRDNPQFLNTHKKRADHGHGDIYSVILSEYVAPGTQDLDVLLHRLLGLKFTSRGHTQVKPLSLAYDWLYYRWSDQQRSLLQEKLAEGTEYIIYRIREKQRLSPYNVYLYNSPLQALIAGAIALYDDHPRGEPVMRFTYDYWKNRVLPVWQQVMGKNGGWHEGGEYIGIGIGDAIYQVPAMWRKATGEDVFAAVPGIHGFLDFLIYRTRPDGTQYRWGDAGFFTRGSNDRLSLAIEYNDAASYSLAKCPRKPIPTAWPWGPLSRMDLCDHEAVKSLPPQHFFDGIGMVVARSDWSKDATYVTFKAGDDYWSHTHLDQGAFTVYKGGALALDSGVYGIGYGSDHHANYSRQAIAHNTVTVTDPADIIPAPAKDQPRPIANDGGQRRIGSGWGIEAAPLDLSEWKAKYEIYHTASLGKIFMKDNLVVAVADLTPAYTNKYSGENTFSHRTRRVEHFTRTFAYDRSDDVIVVFDRVSATQAGFRKRWLLHTSQEPLTTPDGFIVNIAPDPVNQKAGGRLEGHVLLPGNAYIQKLGGTGFEFFTDGKNYDENGAIEKFLRSRKDTEAGAWRIEITPAWEAYDDEFLVVLLPTLGDERPSHRVRLLEDNDRVGCEIAGPKHTTRWWFDKQHEGPLVEISEDSDIIRSHDLRVSEFPVNHD
jgi:hypothetical protein